MANLPICAPVMILSPTLKHWGPSQTAGCYIANPPTCGPFLILSPALKRWGPPGRHGLRSPSAQLWATYDFVPRS